MNEAMWGPSANGDSPRAATGQKDGEADVTKHNRDHAAVPGTGLMDRMLDATIGRTRGRFGWRSLLVSLAGALALSAAPGVPGFAREAKAERIVQISAPTRTTSLVVSIDKSEDVRTDRSFVDVVVGNPEIADVNALTDRTLSILGKKLGTTRVSIYGEDRKLVGVFDVLVSYDTSALAQELSRRFPASKLRVSSVNGRILLSGTVTDGMVLDQALQVAKQFVPDVINSVQVLQPQQVMLEVRFVEASREADRELGVDWNAHGGGSTNFLAKVGSSGIIGSGTAAFGNIGASILGKGLQVDVALSALEQRGLARRLAQPNLVALSGDTANFLAGGEYPIPVPGMSSGQIQVEYKQYGVSLAFTPTVLNGNLINMKIVPEVSQLDPAHSVAIGAGIVVPSLTVRRASSTIELRDGQSFILAGLLQNDLSTAQQQLPWIGDVPVLGTLFSSKSYQRNETDLIIIVTPRLVNPTRPGDEIRTPLSNTLASNDIDFFLMNKPEVLRTEVRGGGAAVERGPIGHMLEMAKGGPHVEAQ
jgi:pilus assembly protein CpaC